MTKNKILLAAGASIMFILVFTVGLVVGMRHDSDKTIIQPPATSEENKEIERKWLLDKTSIPYDLEQDAVERYEIQQTYLNFSPEIRLREITASTGGVFYTMTVKSDTSTDGLTRTEYDWYIAADEYAKLLEKREGNTISKTRFVIEENDQRLQFDIFHQQLDGLAYLEIEFDDEETAKSFNQPSYIVEDVTADKRYKNQSLAQFGIPKN